MNHELFTAVWAVFLLFIGGGLMVSWVVQNLSRSRRVDPREPHAARDLFRHGIRTVRIRERASRKPSSRPADPLDPLSGPAWEDAAPSGDGDAVSAAGHEAGQAPSTGRDLVLTGRGRLAVVEFEIHSCPDTPENRALLESFVKDFPPRD